MVVKSVAKRVANTFAKTETCRVVQLQRVVESCRELQRVIERV
jgi:hypothetical protein